MVFAKQLREGIRRGRIRSSIRIWERPRVKAGGRYRMDEGHIVVDSIEEIEIGDVTDSVARESGFRSVTILLRWPGMATARMLSRSVPLPSAWWDGDCPVAGGKAQRPKTKD